ncbi:carboxypeptidase regulatory-like domain-containing protein [Aquiflexum sp. LQ15W]|uniref:TonB-dependent receptor n=1 Tax=Cognataquiflexum nitidum TaxID=2922272 RepID=UPI001F13DC72|nr:carboxypeptidase regulatory-like domain-containing protein [Cognataquiflexum nitidum]MCH6201686.1 carboxypeptidase regulatory-like domain-containing protein [Cognataquiflexum nitidum]
MRQSLLRSLFAVIMLVFATGVAYSQGVSTSSMSGRVVESSGETLPGANVVATHMPSGTRYGAVTNIDGRYTIPGMRVGGPYSVTVSFIGFETQTVEGVFLSLGIAANVNVTMLGDGEELAEVVVTGDKNAVFSSDRTGATTAIGNETINKLPTISRRIGDFTRLTPQASGNSFAGQDSRLNNITVDGSYFNNSFGLGGQPGDRTGVSPISLDAIDQISVNVAPYDVRQGNFTGAGVNTVTRSGTNTFTGSAYYFWRGSDNVGTQAGDNPFNPGEFKYRQVGFRLGGPIIKNKLFFFASFEDDKQTSPGTAFGANTGSEPITGNKTRVLASDLIGLSSYLRNNFGYETGPFQNYDHTILATKFLAKIDYNINDKNKLSVRYNHLDSSSDILASNSSSLGFGGRNGNLNALNFQNSNYLINENIRSIVAELNTRISPTMTNNLIVGYTYQDESRGSRGDFFPMVDILKDGATYTTFGFEPFTPSNELRYKTFQIQDNLQIFKGKHTITTGFSFERYESENVFFPGSQSVYTYNSLEDFYADANAHLAGTPGPSNLRRFEVRYSNIPGQEKPIQPLKVSYGGIYGQDEIQVNKDFLVTVGLRIDVPFFAETGFRNQEVEGFNFRNPAGETVQFRTDKLPDPNILWSPRVGFNYDLSKGARTTQVRGGTGIFTGRPAYVWISNQVGNNGILTGFERLSSATNAPLTSRPFNPDPNFYKPSNVSGQPAPNYELALTESTFKFPQVWRTNIAIDHRLPGGVIATAEFLYNQDVNGVAYYNANLDNPNAAFTGPDPRSRWIPDARPNTDPNRDPFTNRINNKIDNAVTLSNQAIGNSWVASISLEKPFANGLYLKAFYSYGEARNTVDPGSIAFGSWVNNQHQGDPNNPGVGFSSNSMGHRVVGVLNYSVDLFSFGTTSFSLFWEGRTIGNASYVYGGDFNGDGGFSNDLLYIPATASETNFQQFTSSGRTFTAAEQSAAWEAFINQDKYLSANRGQIAERGAVFLPMVYRADFSASQTLLTTSKKQNLEFRVDILNVGNLLNSDWGVGQFMTSTSPLVPAGVDANNRPQFRFRNLGNTLITDSFTPSAGGADVWRLQFGLRFNF